MTSKNLVLRSMYIEPEIDDMLRNEAFNSRTSKNDLLRKYLSLGIAAARNATAPVVVAKKPAVKRSSTVSPIKQAVAGEKTTARKTSVAAASSKKSAAKPAA